MSRQVVKVGDKVRILKNQYGKVFTGEIEVKKVYWINKTGTCIGVTDDWDEYFWTILPHEYEVVATKPTKSVEDQLREIEDSKVEDNKVGDNK